VKIPTFVKRPAAAFKTKAAVNQPQKLPVRLNQMPPNSRFLNSTKAIAQLPISINLLSQPKAAVELHRRQYLQSIQSWRPTVSQPFRTLSSPKHTALHASQHSLLTIGPNDAHNTLY
jgi:hypothetical protein